MLAIVALLRAIAWIGMGTTVVGLIVAGVAIWNGATAPVAEFALGLDQRPAYMDQRPDIPWTLLGALSFAGTAAIVAYACWSLDRLCAALGRGAILDIALIQAVRRFIGAFLAMELFSASIHSLIAIATGYPEWADIAFDATADGLDALLFAGILYCILSVLIKGLEAAEENREFI